jgi:hypothetical protein
MQFANSPFDEQNHITGESSGYLGTLYDSTGNPVLFSLNDLVVHIDLNDHSLRIEIFITNRYVNIHLALSAFHVIKHARKEHDIITIAIIRVVLPSLLYKERESKTSEL